MAHQLRYSAWASRKLLTFARTIPEADLTRDMHNSHGGILKTFQHIFYADRVWYSRMVPPVQKNFEDPAPGPSLAELDGIWWELLDRFQEWAGQQQDSNRVLEYRNLKQEPFAKPVYQIVTHVVNHGTYHRGQIAAMLRQCGYAPPSTDFIYYVDGLRD
ncbi:diguanylate cyclase [Bryobacterales bacterium F-183]|nr:diguanylate cyclase [Bryobacterales bacterium F-183]